MQILAQNFQFLFGIGLFQNCYKKQNFSYFSPIRKNSSYCPMKGRISQKIA